jgi:hypothetical protein
MKRSVSFEQLVLKILNIGAIRCSDQAIDLLTINSGRKVGLNGDYLR